MLQQYDPDELTEEEYHADEPCDERAADPPFETEWYAGSGTIHVVDPTVEEVSDLANGNVVVVMDDDHHIVDDARLVTARRDTEV